LVLARVCPDLLTGSKKCRFFSLGVDVDQDF